MSAASGNARPRVALVFPYFRTRERTELLFPPLGPAALKAQLARLGVQARVVDGTFSSVAAVVEEVAELRPAIVGISAMVSLTRNALTVAAALRERLPGALLVAGGPLPTVFPGRFLPHVDAVFRGESDLAFPLFCRDYLAASCSRAGLAALRLGDYPGLVTTCEGVAIDNSPVHHSGAEIAGFPAPDRGDVDHAAYQRAWAPTGARPSTLLATFGCPYACEFCSKPVFGTEVRRRPLAAVEAEVRDLVRLGYDALWIADDTFTLDRGYLEGFCERIAPLGLTWSCLSRANGIRPETARAMHAAGCRRVYLGLESGSPRTLELMHKQARVEDGVLAASVYRGAGIGVAGFFIVGYPGETVADVEMTFSLALELPLDEISFNVPIPLPGSALWERLALEDPRRDWTHENDPTLTFDSEFDEEWLGRRIGQTMQAFSAARSPGGARARPAPAAATAAAPEVH